MWAGWRLQEQIVIRLRYPHCGCMLFGYVSASFCCFRQRLSAKPKLVAMTPEKLTDIIERCPVNLSEAQKIDYLLRGLREQHILAAIAANRPPTVAEFIPTCTSLDNSAQHLHAKASPSPFAGSVLPPSQPFRAAKPAERQQPRSENSTPQSSRGATPKTRISELPAEQQEATYAAISAQYGAPAFRSGQDLSQAICYQCHALGHLASKCPTRTSRLSSSAPPTMPKTQQPPALHSAPVMLDGSQQQCPFFTATLSGFEKKAAGRFYQHGSLVPFRCDETHELRPVRTMQMASLSTLAKVVCSFLNSWKLCIVYYGISREGLVHGVMLNHRERDSLRLGIDDMTRRLRPCLMPQSIDVEFVPVLRTREDSRETVSCFVVEVKVRGAPDTMYTTSDGNCYLRDGDMSYQATTQDVRAWVVQKEEARYLQALGLAPLGPLRSADVNSPSKNPWHRVVY
ncbi:hypothetical protein HPB50_014152 [Hyalomma asiaticum]|uniref:Uncharacterized protein n=1 Tax=Hyalomma asiaticum TaxID=266040 RepID=A0ACB7TKP8_HYAAI|nr:hypothetical protein HPB50_014152 [Hyalomma asiaticum]